MNEQVKETGIDQVIHQGYILVKSGFADEVPGHYDKVLNASDGVLTEAAKLYNKASKLPRRKIQAITNQLDEWWIGKAFEYGRAVTLCEYLLRSNFVGNPKEKDIAARLLAIEYLERVTQYQS